MNQAILHNENDFSFFVPATLEKAKNKKGVTEMRIKGIASTSSAEDSDGETLHPEGFDVEPLLRKGFLNWDHQSKKNANAIVGEPDVAQIVNGGRDLYIEGFLYQDSEEAQQIYKLGTILEKNSPSRRLGFSIEGQVIERGCGPEFMNKEKTLRNPDYHPDLWAKVKRARITGCAITPCPKNPNTLMQIMKSQSVMDMDYDQDVLDEVEKAFTAEGASETGLLPEHIEGTINPNKSPLKDSKKKKKKEDEKDDVGRIIRKSEVYGLIADNYTTDVVKAQQIYSFIEKVNQKLFNMNTNAPITSEAIQKAFDFLNQADALVKSDSADKEDKEEGPSKEEIEKAQNADDTDENLEKAKVMCKGFMESNADITKGEMLDGLRKAGFSENTSEGACHACIQAASAAKDGGTITEASFPVINKSETVDEEKGGSAISDLITKSFTDTNELVKSLTANTNSKFSALGKILKSQTEQNELLKGQLDTLQKSNDELTQRLGKVENAPIPSKSMTRVGAVDKFEKSEQSNFPAGAEVYSMSKSEDREALGERLFAEASVSREQGRPDSIIENAVMDLEIQKSITNIVVLSRLKAKGIYVTK